MKKIYYILFSALMASFVIMLTGCGEENDDISPSCPLGCGEINPRSCLFIDGTRYHSHYHRDKVSPIQFVWNQDYVPISYMEEEFHKDGSTWTDFGKRISVSFTYYGYLYYIKVGDRFLDMHTVTCTIHNGIDWDSNIFGDNYDKYISGSVECSKAEGRERTLSLYNLVLENKKTGARKTFNGEVVFMIEESLDEMFEKWKEKYNE